MSNQMRPAAALRHAADALNTSAADLDANDAGATRPVAGIRDRLRDIPALVAGVIEVLERPAKSTHPAVAAAQFLDNDGKPIA